MLLLLAVMSSLPVFPSSGLVCMHLGRRAVRRRKLEILCGVSKGKTDPSCAKK